MRETAIAHIDFRDLSEVNDTVPILGIWTYSIGKY